MDALVAFAQPGLLETEDDRVEVELTREGPPGVPPPRVSHRRHPGLGPRSRARCAQRPRSALVASAGIASGLLNASMQFGGALGLAILSAVATDRTNTVLEHGGTVPLASPPASNAPS